MLINNGDMKSDNKEINTNYLKNILDLNKLMKENPYDNFDFVDGIKTNYEKKYEKELQKLREMGYNNDKLNLELLINYNGNIFSVIENLN
jgi:hypothetical protein